MNTPKNLFERRKARVRTAIKAAANGKLRLSVFRSGKHIYAQIIDDVKGSTVASASTLDKEVRANIFMNKMNSDWEPALSEIITFTEETSVISVSMESHVMQNADYELLLQFGELNTFDGAKIEIQNIKIYAQDYIF